MDLVTLNGYTPPAPTEYSLDIQDIDSSDTGRGETGYMVRERVREGIYKLSLAFTNITSNQVLSIKEAISPESFPVTLFDGEDVTVTMYAGNRALVLKSIDDESNCFWDMSFSLTQY